jgi:DMSO/TMAO reductase YedYZ molybdopterin-dependent catalytic subunit
MTPAAVDRLLGVLVAAVGATGLLTLRAGDASGAALYALHGMLSWMLAATIVVKLVHSIPRAMAGRHWRRLAIASAVASLSLLAVAGGIAWATSGRIVSISGWTLLTLHAYAGLALIPFLAAHLSPRRWRLLWPSRFVRAWLARVAAAGSAAAPAMTAGAGRHVSRRSLLAAGALAVIGLAGWTGARLLDTLRGADRRFTGSRWLAPNGIPPSTTFFGEGVPTIAPGQWRLAVHGRVAHPASYTMSELQALAHSELVAVLDCTSGWAIETTWAGIPMAAVLAAAGPGEDASRVEVRSVTGWGAGLSLAEANRTLLATHVAGEPLPAGNGAPCRLVVHERRGLDWVKWVTDIEVT